MKLRFLSLVFSILPIIGFSQENILDNPEIQEKVEKCLSSTYNFNFSEANSLHSEIMKALPEHPVTPFLEALIIYWENFPLLPGEDQSYEFILLMKESIKGANIIMKEDPENIEGIFFDLHARAFIAMFWADNGKPGKVLKDIDNLYRQTMRGIDLKEKFNEFYFSSGLYRYYIEAYVELHPVYKPIAALFRKGDKVGGLIELQYAIDNTTYIKVESLLFMSLLQLNYEENMEEALEYAAILYNNYPNNTYYIGHYLMILLYQNEFEMASIILDRISMTKDDFSQMIFSIMEGFVIENSQKNLIKAKRMYEEGIVAAEKFGPFADIYQAIAYAGLSRIAKSDNSQRASRKNRRKSESLSNYEFILSY